jgi:hypothetical protein
MENQHFNKSNNYGIPQHVLDATERARKRVKSDDEIGGLTFIEQLTALQVNCEAVGVPFMYRLDEETRQIEFGKGRCGMWTCEQCAIHNAKKWIARIIDGVNKLPSDDWYFATVTAHKWHRGEKSLVNLRANWHKLRKRMARLIKPLFYVRVWEHHKDGSYHLHIITNACVTTRWLKDNAVACGMGYQAKIDKTINAGQAAGYVAKYMLKQSENMTLHTYPPKAHRIETSNNWVAWHKKESDWRYAGNFESAKGIAEYRKASGWLVHDLAIRNEEKRRNQMTKGKE